jgi:hypothetical protein
VELQGGGSAARATKRRVTLNGCLNGLVCTSERLRHVIVCFNAKTEGVARRPGHALTGRASAKRIEDFGAREEWSTFTRET